MEYGGVATTIVMLGVIVIFITSPALLRALCIAMVNVCWFFLEVAVWAMGRAQRLEERRRK